MPEDTQIGKTCNYCGVEHRGVCPLVRSMRFYESGAVKQVEFFERKPPCEHREKIDYSVMGLEQWRCRDCGFEYQRDLNG